MEKWMSMSLRNRRMNKKKSIRSKKRSRRRSKTMPSSKEDPAKATKLAMHVSASTASPNS